MLLRSLFSRISAVRKTVDIRNISTIKISFTVSRWSLEVASSRVLSTAVASETRYPPKVNDNIRRDKIKLHITESLQLPDNNLDVRRFMDLLENCREMDVDLDLQSLTKVIHRLVAVSSNPARERALFYKILSWTYNKIQLQHKVPTEVFSNMMKICRSVGNKPLSKIVYNDSKMFFPTVNQQFIENYIFLILNNDLSSIEEILDIYNEYHDVVNKKPWDTKISIYLHFVDNLLRKRDDMNALKILQECFGIEHAPSHTDSKVLLDAAIYGECHMTISKIFEWYANGTLKEALPFKMIYESLKIASKIKNAELRTACFELAVKWDLELKPIIYQEDMDLLFDYLDSNDIINAIKVLQSMEEQGINLTTLESNNKDYNKLKMQVYLQNLYSSIQSRFVEYLTYFMGYDSQLFFVNKVKPLDDLYFLLIEESRLGRKVPRVALDAIVDAAGRLYLTDRSFATFQEFQPLFNVQPDINSYNSLLTSCYMNRFSTLKEFFAILREMEATINDKNVIPCPPNSKSYSLLLEKMILLNDFSILDDILAHMKSINIYPRARTVRRLIIKFAQKGNTKKVDEYLSLLKEISNGEEPPSFLTYRLELIKKSRTSAGMN
eukprot:gene12591-16884_t